MPLDMEVGLRAGHIVLDGDAAPLPQKGAQQPPHFSAHVCCGQTRLDGSTIPSSPTERGTVTASAPHLSAHVYCGQTVAHLSNC